MKTKRDFYIAKVVVASLHIQFEANYNMELYDLVVPCGIYA